MKAKIFMVIMMVSISAALVAQVDNVPGKFQKRPGRDVQMHELRGAIQGLNLTDAQKESFKASTIATQKLLQPLRNELGEAEAHQKTLETAEKPDFTAIDKNIDKIGGLRIEMAKIQTKHRLEMRAQLTDEQKLKFDLFKESRKFGKGPKGPKGPKGMR